MQIKVIDEHNYNVLISWYLLWNLPITPFSFIPKNSFFVDDICAGFLYKLDATPIFWIEGIISNPLIKDKNIKDIGLSVLINKMEEVAKKDNGKLLLSSTPRKNLNSIFLNTGFKNTPENYFHLAKEI